MAERLLAIENVLFTLTVIFYLAAMVFYFVFFIAKKVKFGKYGSCVMLAAFALHTIALVCRGIGAGRAPLTNQYEFATSFAWGISLCFLLLERKFSFRAMGTFVAPIVFLIIGYAAMQNREIQPLMPALQSNWLVFHVCTAVISYGAFGVACGISGLYLIRDKMKQTAFIEQHLPGKEQLDLFSYRAVALGFLFLTLVIITGALWAQRAWGHYWSWDPKETWSLITWIIYALYLHVRLSRGWMGKKAAMFAVIGFVCVVFTYIGVNMWIPSIHSYA